MDADNIAQSAQGMIKNFGCEAAAHAEQQAQRYARCHDEIGVETWRAIAAAVRRIADTPSQASLPPKAPNLPVTLTG